MKITNIDHFNWCQDVAEIPIALRWIEAGCEIDNPHTVPAYVSPDVFNQLELATKDLIDRTSFAEASELASILAGDLPIQERNLFPEVEKAITDLQTYLRETTRPKLEKQLARSKTRFNALPEEDQKLAQEEVTALRAKHRPQASLGYPTERESLAFSVEEFVVVIEWIEGNTKSWDMIPSIIHREIDRLCDTGYPPAKIMREDILINPTDPRYAEAITQIRERLRAEQLLAYKEAVAQLRSPKTPYNAEAMDAVVQGRRLVHWIQYEFSEWERISEVPKFFKERFQECLRYHAFEQASGGIHLTERPQGKCMKS